jgi:hypothetical protein
VRLDTNRFILCGTKRGKKFAANFLQTKVAKNETSDKPSLKSPPGFQADQHKYPPQHKPGEPEGSLLLFMSYVTI